MAKKATKSAADLREEAKKLLAKAELIESDKALKIGKLVLKHSAKNFEGFDLEKFKAEVQKIEVA